MIDIRTETLLSLAEAAKRIPPYRGKRVSYSCVFRWGFTGIRSRDDDTVIRLRMAKLGGRWITSIEAIQEFLEAQTPKMAPKMERRREHGQAEQATATGRHTMKRVDRAAAELATAGI